MRKLSAKDPETHSADLVAENVSRLRDIFPEAFIEGRVDFDVLRQLLGDAVEEGDEKYGLNWHGKREARRLALTPGTGTLRPSPEESVDWDKTQNLIIEGDNLEVLKLLQKSFYGKVKAIYIDPPYNTGRDLIYKNDYRENPRDYLATTGQADSENGRFVSNPKTGGRYHSNWLNMMYPRLKLARTLLRKDGVLICTIDENEQAALGVVLKEIFEEGSYNHVCVTIVHNPRGIQGMNFSYTNEYAYFVFPSNTKVIADRKLKNAEISWSNFRNWGSESRRVDAKNCFYPVLVRGENVIGFGDVCDDDFHPEQIEMSNDVTLIYPIDKSNVERKWRYARQSAESVRHLLRAKRQGERYEIEIRKETGLYRTVWTDTKYDANEYGTRLLQSLMPNCSFSFPKSIWAVHDCLLASVEDDHNAIVLDFFAGSGTTGHALQEINKNDSGKRRYILVQIPEAIKQPSEFLTVAELTKERMRRVGSKVKDANAEATEDLGFRVFKLDSSNIRAWDPDPNSLEQNLLDSVDNIKQDRSEQDILYELLLKLGLDLCAPIEIRQMVGKQVHAVDGGALITCLAAEISETDIERLALGIAEWRAQLQNMADTRVVFRDSAFANDVAKTNCTEILRQSGIKDVWSI